MIRRFAGRAMLLASFAALASPLTAQASSMHGVDACVKMFIDEQIPHGMNVRVTTGENLSPADFRFGTRPRVVIKAIGQDSGKEYASARCVVNRRGDLLAMYVDGAQVYLAGYHRRDDTRLARR